jgi:outer membrane protein assembly factor BamA
VPSSRTSARIAILLTGLMLAAPAEAHLVVGRIVVDGPTKVTTSVLSGRMNLAEGDAIDFEKLRNAEQRLMESELFTAVHVYIDLATDEAARLMYVEDTVEKIDVHVQVTEKTSWFLVPIASFGSGSYAGGIVYGDQDLFGHDLQLLVAGQVGQTKSFAFVGFRDPLVNGAPLTWGIGALVRYDQIRFFVNHELVLTVPTLVEGGEAEVGWVLSPHLRALAGFSARYQHVDPAEAVDPAAVQPAYNPLDGRIFLLVFRIAYDDTRAPDGLRRGVRLLLKDELSDRYWGSDFDYSKFEARAELYGKVAWNYPSLMLDFTINYPTSSRGVPLTETIRIGGSNLRGYLTNEFHGDTLLSVQAEDQVVLFRDVPLPLVDARFNIAAAVFIDAAALLERHPGGTTVDLPGPVRPALSDFHTSFGAGVRMILPGVAIPALKADIGYGIDVSSFAITVSIAGGT